MKRIFTFFFALLSICTFSSYAAVVNGTCGDNLTWTLNTKDSTLVIAGTGKMTNYNNYSSFAPWLDYRSYIKYVTLPDGLTSIGGHAFSWCESLTSITIPNSVTSIGELAFQGCRSLTSITIPNSVTNIGEFAFDWCEGLASITIPNSVTSIGERAFGYCSSLTSITIPNSVTSIGKSAFASCSGLTSIIVEEGNTMYDSRENCNAIIETATNTLIAGCQNTIIPNSVTSIGDEAFMKCSGLTFIIIPNSVTSIGGHAFSVCSGLTSVTIPNSVTSIGIGAFCNCSALTSITIGNSVTSIGDEAFAFCESLTSITIPNSVTSIGERAFQYCSKIQEVTSYAATPPAATTCGLNQTVCILNVPAEYLDIYSNTLWWEDFKEIRAIDPNLVGGNKDLTLVFKDQDNTQISTQSITVMFPPVPDIKGFTFLYWQPVAEPVEDKITLQAVYEATTAAPEVYVNPSNPAQKLIRNGQVYILHEEKEYTISGQVVK